MKKLLTYFMQGLVLVAPIVITIYIVFLIFDFIDGILRNQLESWIVSSPFKALADQLLKKAPLLQVIYSSLVDLFSAFVGKEKKFNRPVLVEINKENNLWKIGFVTQKSMAEMGMEGLVAVYFPHSYNFSGELYMITASAVKPLEMPPSEAMKFVVSGGVTKVN